VALVAVPASSQAMRCKSDRWSTFGFVRWLLLGWLVRKTSEDVSNNVPLITIPAIGKPQRA